MPFIEFYLTESGMDISFRSESISAVQALEDDKSCLIMASGLVFQVQGNKDEALYAIQSAERNVSARVAISPEHTKLLQSLPLPSVKQ